MMYSELQSILKDSSSNNGKGRLLEVPLKAILHNQGYTVDGHHITSGGLDIVATKGNETVIAECINWYGGYIHPKRFLSIIKNLAQPATHKFFFCCGSYPTQEQCRVLHAMNVNIIHYEEQILRVDYRVINHLRSKLLGVITTVNSTDSLVNKESSKSQVESQSEENHELEEKKELVLAHKQVFKQRFKQFLDKLLVFRSKGYEQFDETKMIVAKHRYEESSQSTSTAYALVHIDERKRKCKHRDASTNRVFRHNINCCTYFKLLRKQLEPNFVSNYTLFFWKRRMG